jgi:hypothetical protein
MPNTSDDELIVVIPRKLDELPPPGTYKLRLEHIRQGRFGGWTKFQWTWAYIAHPGATFRTLTNTSLTRSNALGLITALNGGQRPAGDAVDLRSFVGKGLVAKTALKANGHPALVAVRPTGESAYRYQMQTKPTERIPKEQR